MVCLVFLLVAVVDIHQQPDDEEERAQQHQYRCQCRVHANILINEESVAGIIPQLIYQ